MRKALTAALFQAYVFALAALQALGGVRTDEAKYLLDIPYPHPPLVRAVLSWTELWPMQEAFWRCVFATLLVQAAWLVWTMAPDLPRRTRMALCACWLLSAPVVLQAGSIMMAPLNALQGLVLLWFWMRPDIGLRRSLGWLGLFWGASLFTAYQVGLYLPVVIALAARSRAPRRQQIACVLAPPALLALYALGNPLNLASFLLAGGKDAAEVMAARAGALAWTVAGLGGSGMLAVAGAAGVVRARAWPVAVSIFLLCAFIAVSNQSYYAVLLLPPFIAGAALLLRAVPRLGLPLLAATALGTLVLLVLVHLPLPLFVPGPARATMRMLAEEGFSGEILIHGSFGHEWQYESAWPIARDVPARRAGAGAIVCLAECGVVGEGWVRVGEGEPAVWLWRGA